MLKLLRRKRDECEDKVVELVKGVMSLMESAQSKAREDESNAQVERLKQFRKELEAQMQRGLGNAAQGVCTQVVKDAIGGCFKTTEGVHLARFPLLCSWAQQQLKPLVEQAPPADPNTPCAALPSKRCRLTPTPVAWQAHAAATVQLAQLFTALSPHVMLRGTKPFDHTAAMRSVVGTTLRRIMVQHHVHDVFQRLPAALESIPAVVVINGKARSILEEEP